MQFTQIPESLGPSREEVELSMQTTTSNKVVAEKKSTANLNRTILFVDTIVD